MKRKSQIEKVEDWLRKGKSLMPLQALRLFGTLRLGARIYTLRQGGMNISTEYVKVRKHTTVAKYKLIE